MGICAFPSNLRIFNACSEGQKIVVLNVLVFLYVLIVAEILFRSVWSAR